MSLTLLGVLENAKYNLSSKVGIQKDLGLGQLSNAILLFNDGAEITDQFDEIDLKRLKEK